MAKINYIHRRPVINGVIQNTGGYTIAYREVEGGIEYALAFCSPRDNFSRHLGRIKAAGRLDSEHYREFVAQSFEDFKNSAYLEEVY